MPLSLTAPRLTRRLLACASGRRVIRGFESGALPRRSRGIPVLPVTSISLELFRKTCYSLNPWKGGKVRTPLFFLIAVAAASMAPAGRTAAAAEGQALAAFASERIMGRWVGSYFGTIPAESVSFNGCEGALVEGLSAGGFSVPSGAVSVAQGVEARRLRTVFQRYPDVSTMSNDTAVRAADIVGRNVRAVIACGAVAAVRKSRQKNAGAICANVECKAVDITTKRRVATAAGERCAGASRDTAVAVSLIRQACREIGDTLALDLKGRY